MNKFEEMVRIKIKNRVIWRFTSKKYLQKSNISEKYDILCKKNQNVKKEYNNQTRKNKKYTKQNNSRNKP
jgi:hypothetical protein